MKFTIRDLLLVTVIVTLALGWGVDRYRLAKEIGEFKDPELLRWQTVVLKSMLAERGVYVEYVGGHDWKVEENGQTKIEMRNR